MKHFEILGGKAYVVELPEGAFDPRITQPFGIYLTFNDRFGFNRIKLPTGTWQIVGRLSEVTEEQAAGTVKKLGTSFSYPTYADYQRENFFCHTAVNSLESAILAEKYYLDYNPIKVHTWASENADDYKKQYDAAQSHVLSRGRCLLLRRVWG